MIKVFYYYYYLFYTKILPDDEPHATVIFTLSFTLASLINGVINIFLAQIVGYALGKWEMISIFLVIMIINYFVYFRTGRAKQVVKEQPMFFDNQKLSIVITAIFLIVCISFLFWSPIYVKNLLDAR